MDKVQGNLSIRNIMNEIATNPEMVSNGNHNIMRNREPISSSDRYDIDMEDIIPFLGTDPSVLGLLKDYLNAKADYQAALIEHDKDNALTEIAEYHADSTWCALQVRIHELKADKAAMSRAALLEKLNEQKSGMEKERLVKHRKEQYEKSVDEITFKRRKKNNESSLNWVLLIFAIMTWKNTISWFHYNQLKTPA